MNLLDLARSALPAPALALTPVGRQATQGERRELVDLLGTILPGDPDGQAEALAIALGDVDDALMCFRALAADCPANTRQPLPENRIRCPDCCNLRGRICSVAAPDGVVVGRLGMEPIRDLLHRCPGFMPRPLVATTISCPSDPQANGGDHLVPERCVESAVGASYAPRPT